MVELILGTYGLLCWLVFKKFRLIPTNTYTVVTAILIAVVALGFGGLLLIRYMPTSTDARLYALTTPIIPDVKGIVIEVPVKGNVPLKQGDVLFRIDPRPYQFKVDRLEAALAAASTTVAQLDERKTAAEAVVKQAQAAIGKVKAELDFSRSQYERYRDLVGKGTVSKTDFERMKQRFDEASQQYSQVQASLSQAEAQLRDASLAQEAEIAGENPATKQIRADLDAARWELDQTTVRAPADGYVTQVILRPGQMAVPLPFAPAMVFVQGEKPYLAASFPQNVIAVLKVGDEAELAFEAYPGEIFKAKLKQIAPVTPEGQLLASGVVRDTTPAKVSDRVTLVFDYDEDVEKLKLPAGAHATVAIYTEHFHALSLIRKIILRIKSWENYLFIP